jgi:O-methyltransferase involved in polyketide biosynthesis
LRFGARNNALKRGLPTQTKPFVGLMPRKASAEEEGDAMKKGRASITVQGIAFARAYETSKPPGERICNDPLARQLMHPLCYWMGLLFASPAERKDPGMMGFVAARCRHIDDYLLARLAEGRQQLDHL